MDNVLILEGKQGKGKSTAIGILFGDWFTDAPLPIGDKDAYQVIQGKWGCEIPELDSFHKAEVTTLKRFFSQQVDRYRPSYGRVAQDHPRQTVFFGTTNNDVYLRDYTGNRRFWPVYCFVVNKDWVTDNRDQLWAEALHRYRQGERWWIDPEKLDDAELMEIVERTQNSRRQEDPWEGYIIEYLGGKESEQISTKDILANAIKIDPAHQQQAHMNRLGPIMKMLGWQSKQKWVNVDGQKRQRRFWIHESVDEVPLDD